jgi:hypothetical protein
MTEYCFNLAYFLYIPIIFLPIQIVGLTFFRLIFLLSGALFLLAQAYLLAFLIMIQWIVLVENWKVLVILYTVFVLTGAYFIKTITPIAGLSLFTLVLGHYHLVVPKLSEKFLFYAQIILFILLLVSLLLSKFSFNLYSLLSICWTFIIPGILLIFSSFLTKKRSLQSATGFLYVIFFFILSGTLLHECFGILPSVQ